MNLDQTSTSGVTLTQPSFLQFVQPMNMWGEVQMPVNLVQQ